MSSPITPISLGGLGPAVAPTPAPRSQPGIFQNVLERAIGQVEDLRQSADQSIGRFLSGEGEELHTTVMATQRAELSFELFLQMRNKVVQAYQEIMRMQM
jgi:flagellar hook-basal body complex protein FliE